MIPPEKCYTARAPPASFSARLLKGWFFAASHQPPVAPRVAVTSGESLQNNGKYSSTMRASCFIWHPAPKIAAEYLRILHQFGSNDEMRLWAEAYVDHHAGRLCWDAEFLTTNYDFVNFRKSQEACRLRVDRYFWRRRTSYKGTARSRIHDIAQIIASGLVPSLGDDIVVGVLDQT
jgi:hypothetical protein